MDKVFKLNSEYKPAGDQPEAIKNLTSGVLAGAEHQTLLGATGTGKTFTVANVISNTNLPTLVLAHNKTLAAQLFTEFKRFFPENAVEYFVSYYDYYQPEAYVPRRDLYIEKDSDINETIERYRSAATQALLSRRDVIIVASVSCIYGLGNPEDYLTLSRHLTVGEKYPREKLIRQLIDMQYERSEYDFFNGMFRVRGDILDIYTASSEQAIRIEYFGDEIESLRVINPVSGEVLDSPTELTVFPAKQFVTPYERLKEVIPKIRDDMEAEVKRFQSAGRDIEAMRLRQRVNYDLEMLQETGYTKGIENYSRYIERREIGSPPSCLLDYFPEDWLLVVDESHITIPQVRGMFNGDQARKQNLVDYGFRLRAALDNRPLKFDEFNERINKAIYISATPSDYEMNISRQSVSKTNIATKEYDGVAQQIIRPTGLIDPIVELRPVLPEKLEQLKGDVQSGGYSDMGIASASEWHQTQVQNLTEEIKLVTAKGQRVLVTTLTKRTAEELATYLQEANIKSKYLHSDIDAIERVEILRELRTGSYDVLVGINLLREGLDLPEVSLVAILDADKEGFLRSDTSLIQTSGRAARHQEGRVIMYADKITGSMKRAIDETRRRRAVQQKFNEDNNITPQSIIKAISNDFMVDDNQTDLGLPDTEEIVERSSSFKLMPKAERKGYIRELEVQMEMFADMLEYEKATEIRDLINSLSK